jgi:hypothetical protein
MTQETQEENIHTICGDCQKFQPGEGEKLFNCTKGFHAGFKYGMQVREDSRACDAYESK